MNQLGDLLFSLPVLEAARKQYPNAVIYSVVRPNLAELLRATGLTDKIFIKEKKFIDNFKMIKEIRTENIKNAVLFSESPETLITAFLCVSGKRTGFTTASLSFLLTERAPKKGVPSLYNNIKLAEKFGIKNVRHNYTEIVKIKPENEQNAVQWLNKNNIKENNFIIISAGASSRRLEKCLKNEVWAETVNKLHDMNMTVVFTAAIWEKDSVESIISGCYKKPYVYYPQNGLADMSAFMKKGALFIGIDSGLMHLAAAVGLRCIALYGNTDPSQIGPQPFDKHIIIKKNNTKDILAADIIEQVSKDIIKKT